MPKHYVCRLDHDTGFAPNIEYRICTLSGCKKTTIERWAKRGSWVIGIGGNNTGKPDKLIYAMEVEDKLPYRQFKKRYPRKSRYLQKEKAGHYVLISKKFYYFGDNAVDLPEKFIIDRQGCRCVSENDVTEFKKHIETKGYRKYGIYGEPNNFRII